MFLDFKCNFLFISITMLFRRSIKIGNNRYYLQTKILKKYSNYDSHDKFNRLPPKEEINILFKCITFETFEKKNQKFPKCHQINISIADSAIRVIDQYYFGQPTFVAILFETIFEREFMNKIIYTIRL